MVTSDALNQVSPLRSRPTIFGNICEKNVVYLIDISGSMYHSLDVVKEHLLEILFARAISGRDTMFNMISFCEEVDKWSDRLIQCTPRTVSVASEWVNNLSCGTSTNTMEALLQAFEDDCVEAVYMVTDGLPDQRPAVILENVRKVYKYRPVHSIYLTGTHADPAAREFLEDLSRLTQGSFHIISLTVYGGIQNVIPVFNYNTTYARKFDKEMISQNLLVDYKNHNINTDSHTELQKGPGTAPPASGFVPRIYDPGTPVTLLRAPHGVIPIPYVSWRKYAQPRGSSKILDYADAVVKARGLADEVGVSKSNVPVAASIMTGMKVLARRDTDGLYYMAVVKEQLPDGSFLVDFEKCPALRKSYVQDVGLHDMIAYKDAIRHHVCLGDKVLAPWQPDGRYGPGTVLDGVDRRDPQPTGHEGSGKLLVTFYNGETVDIDPGVALRIPLATFDRIVTELQLPESQRRKIKLASSTEVPPFNGRSPPVKNTWTRPFTPPTTAMKTGGERDKAELNAKIEEQLKRNKHLLDRLEMREKEPQTTKSISFLEPAENCDCGMFSEDSYNLEEDRRKTEMFDVGTETDDFDRYTRVAPPVAPVVLNKAGGKPEPKKRWRPWSSGTRSRPPRFRETLLSKPYEVRDKSPTRPPHSDYQTTVGVPFPPATDNKFAQFETWKGPHHQWQKVSNGQPQSAPNLQVRHNEDMTNKGVAFPVAADRKFFTAPDQNWHPGQSTQYPAGYRSANWEDGLGHGDMAKNRREQARLLRKKDASERYHNQIRSQAAAKEQRAAAKEDYHRRVVEERNSQIEEQSATKERQEANRLDFKKQTAKSVCQKERERQEKAENWKHARINAMKERKIKHDEMEHSYEEAAQEYRASREEGFREREEQRRKLYHDRLVADQQVEERRNTRLKERENAKQTLLDSIKRDTDKQKEMRIHIKKQNEQKYRASIIP